MRWQRTVSCRVSIAIFGAALLTGSSEAEVIHQRDYQTHEPRDRGVLFGMALTPDQDVLSLVAKKDGKWRLTRIRHWEDKKPSDETIEIPGMAERDFANPSAPWTASLLVTFDGRFAVCIASGSGIVDTHAVFDDVVSVVDLRDFKVIATRHAPAAPDETRSFDFDETRRLRLRAESKSASRWVTLDLPDLDVWESGSTPRDNSQASRRARVVPPSKVERSPGCTFSKVTPDGKFELEFCGSQRQRRWMLIRSIKTGNVGRIEDARWDSTNSKLAELRGRIFLLVLEGGTKLKVYELKE
jgi:hypothetical protein